MLCNNYYYVLQYSNIVCTLYICVQSTKAVYNRIIDLKIATPQIIINFAMFLEENNYFEEAFKVHRTTCKINVYRTIMYIFTLDC